MAEQIDDYFTSVVSGLVPGESRPGVGPEDPVQPPSPLSVQGALDLFDAQVGSRHLDLAARWLRSRGKGFYTIGSSGHGEGTCNFSDRAMEKATPTARGRCEAMVEVWGMMLRS